MIFPGERRRQGTGSKPVEENDAHFQVLRQWESITG